MKNPAKVKGAKQYAFSKKLSKEKEVLIPEELVIV
jgi:hypothetical protein